MPRLDRRGLLQGFAAAAAAAGPALGKGSAYPALQALIDAYVAEGLVPGAVTSYQIPSLKPLKLPPL
jgi:hypothetical protein